ncbi:hypothetical protein CARUB_v10020308mg [Capsella rubella]|uniref:Uncharacterized protein n=1 Tax=Capsella rubella TaxID=81985 RepID=R0GCB4_9BRAS|nr:uncharacterized protein LOC17894262 [Capsella rubella]EOA33382.1 hypothetical protein CARUB_v10020308mg [Capsella rubella]
MQSNPISGVLRRNGRLPPAYLGCYPFDSGSGSGKEEMKEEVIRLGVELSLYVARSMFLLSDDIRTVLWFCCALWRCVMYHDRVLQRVLLVMNHVYSYGIKPKNAVFLNAGNSVHWDLVATAWDEFADGIIVLHRLFLPLCRKDACFYDDRLLSSAFAKYKLILKNLDAKLSSSLSEANGFAREAFESNIFTLWKSLFDDGADQAAPKLMEILTDLFTPLLKTPFHSGVLALPLRSPYILGKDFPKQELKEEVALLGVELSLYVARSMFLLCDDIRSMLRFCCKLWIGAKGDDMMMIPDSPVVERLLFSIHFVYSKHIKPKHGGYQRNDGKSVRWELIRTTWENFDSGIRDLDRLVLILRVKGSCFNGRELTSRIEGALKKVDDTLRCAKAVSEANGFAREAMEPDIQDLWKSLFDKEAKQVINHAVLVDLFLPLCIEAVPH